MLKNCQRNNLLFFIICFALVLMLFGGNPAHAINASGYVHCDKNNDGKLTIDDPRAEGVVVNVKSTNIPYSNYATTDATGYFAVPLLSSPQTYIETLDPATIPSNATILIPDSGQYILHVTNPSIDPRRNFWLLSNCHLEHTCDLEVIKTATPDTVTPVPTPSCANQSGKPNSLTFKYTGGGCAASNNTQATGKAVCSGVVNDSIAVTVVAGDKKMKELYTVVPMVVAKGGEFTISTSRISSDSNIAITNYGGTENNLIHTSCSQPLKVGDVFGSLTLVAFNGQRAANNEVTYTYEITNYGDNLNNITVNDDKLGQIAVIDHLYSGETQTFSQSAEIFATTTNTVEAIGTLQSGLECLATDSATVTIQEPPDPQLSCTDGKPTALLFEYTGASCDATTNTQNGKFKCKGTLNGEEPIRVVITKDAKKVIADPNIESVYVGDQVIIYRKNGDKLASETKFDIRQGLKVLQSLTIHTSCSKPLNVGDQFGSMVLQKFIPKQ